jgi:hypothetical protein
VHAPVVGLASTIVDECSQTCSTAGLRVSAVLVSSSFKELEGGCVCEVPQAGAARAAR